MPESPPAISWGIKALPDANRNTLFSSVAHGVTYAVANERTCAKTVANFWHEDSLSLMKAVQDAGH